MAEIGVGKEVLSLCNKCKLSLAHIIVTMKTQTVPDKVMCKTCKGTHSFKDPSEKPKAASTNKIIRSGKPSSSKKSENILDLWTKALNKSTASAKEYTIKGSFQTGDVIEHTSFGQGVVERNIDNDKIEVLFKDDYRTLIHRK